MTDSPPPPGPSAGDDAAGIADLENPAPAPAASTIDLLRGIRWGAALSTALLAVAAFLVHHYMEPTAPLIDRESITLPIPQCAAGLIAWRIGRNRRSPSSRLMICVLIGSLGLGAASTLISWLLLVIRGSVIITGGLAACALLALTTALTLDLVLCRSAGSAVPRPPGAEAWRPVSLRRHGRIGLLGTAAALLVPVLATTSLAVALTPDPVTQTTAPDQPDDQLPLTPASVSGQVAWQRAVDEPVVDVAAGRAGPVLITGNGVIGLNGNDGTELWSYQHARGTIEMVDGTERDTRDEAARRSVTSPDGDRIAVVLTIAPVTGDSRRLLILVLDTVTGRVIVERTKDRPGESASANKIDRAMPTIQMTDSVALIDSQAFSLADGSPMWDKGADIHTDFSGTAGHHTLVTDMGCGSDSEQPMTLGACTLTLINDDDPTSAHSVGGVVGSGSDKLTMVDGWVVRYSRGERPAPQTQAESIGRPMEALDIDSISADITGAAPSDARVVELGEFGGPDPWSSRSFIALHQATRTDEMDEYESVRRVPIAALFDPFTGTVLSLSEDMQTRHDDSSDHQPTGWSTADTGVAVTTRVPLTNRPESIRLTRPDGSTAVTAGSDALLRAGRPYLDTPQTIAAPGAVVMWTLIKDDWDDSGSIEDRPRKATLIYGLR